MVDERLFNYLSLTLCMSLLITAMSNLFDAVADCN
jgi:hypothetical protein